MVLSCVVLTISTPDARFPSAPPNTSGAPFHLRAPARHLESPNGAPITQPRVESPPQRGAILPWDPPPIIPRTLKAVPSTPAHLLGPQHSTLLPDARRLSWPCCRTTAVSGRRRHERWSARGALESPPSLERTTKAAVRLHRFVSHRGLSIAAHVGGCQCALRLRQRAMRTLALARPAVCSSAVKLTGSYHAPPRAR